MLFCEAELLASDKVVFWLLRTGKQVLKDTPYKFWGKKKFCTQCYNFKLPHKKLYLMKITRNTLATIVMTESLVSVVFQVVQGADVLLCLL